MNNSGKMMADHILKRFDEELIKLTSRIGKMGDVVQQQVAEAMAALREGDTARAAEVVEQDDRVDLFDIKIEKHCMRLLALQQPVALDLRTVLSAMYINRHLERIGDGAVNIAERVPLLAGNAPLIQRSRVLEMGALVESMIRDALQAFLGSDVATARAVAMRDNVIDECDARNFEILTGIMSDDPSQIQAASHLMMVSRNLERIGDEATNIAEEAVFVADAKIVKHGGWDVNPFDET